MNIKTLYKFILGFIFLICTSNLAIAMTCPTPGALPQADWQNYANSPISSNATFAKAIYGLFSFAPKSVFCVYTNDDKREYILISDFSITKPNVTTNHNWHLEYNQPTCTATNVNTCSFSKATH